LYKRSKIPSCDKCGAFEDNPADFAREQICPSCEWGKPYFNPYLDKLRYYLGLQDALCQIGRHELTNDDWLALGELRSERELIIFEDARKQG